ncbi:low molecular weight phosphatase family protein [Nakamurella sp. PAMC28650]|uniref:arsenate reductase/protein-tyrosine-phosphatase family protein n=1 Tax=Nakamurella sp. PAMC28650 TaxID=2762325 RepID=UPI00164E0727|nr:low molecular weight phosphatase family protein [Nakamurella sp. PAMC28650]QNK80969.1 low molecular weight phosphatase family protein [Nakamurella sp. PAMC28650]
MTKQDAPPSLRVLLVCTANICRSPMAEFLMKQAVLERWGRRTAGQILVRSAGLHAREGVSIHPFARTAVGEPPDREDDRPLGDARTQWFENFRSQRVTAELITDSDLILTATRDHRSEVVGLVPSALRRSFTIRQIASLLVSAEPVDMSGPTAIGTAIIERVQRARAHIPPGGPDDDLVDPIGHPIEVFQSCASIIRRSVDSILEALRPS